MTTSAHSEPQVKPQEKEGEIHFSYPFILEEVSLFDGESERIEKRYRPGVRTVLLPPDGGSTEDYADGVGLQIVTVISTHKPGKFPERVFYTRQWKDPAGNVFGKTKLFTKTRGHFNRLIRGYAFEYKVKDTTHADKGATNDKQG